MFEVACARAACCCGGCALECHSFSVIPRLARVRCSGGITPDNAKAYLDAGASHVIVTSYVFRDGVIDWERLEALVAAVGKERLVLDLSCRYVTP